MKRLLLVFAFMLSTSFVLLAQNSERKVTDIVLKSVIGYDGQPITSGYVYGLDISKGLPLKVTDDGGYRSEVGMDFTLPGYESFYYDWTYGESPEITIDLRDVARPAKWKVVSHDGALLPGAELVSTTSNNPKVTLAQTDAEGIANFYLVDDSKANYRPMSITVVPQAKYHTAYAVPSTKYNKTYYASNTLIDYSKMHLFLMRVKDFNTDLRKRMFSDELTTSYNLSYETVRNGQSTTSFVRNAYVDEGSDRVYYSMVYNDENCPITKAWYRFSFSGDKSVNTFSSYPFYREYDKLEGDYEFELSPTTWRPVRINVKDDLGTALVPRNLWVDGVRPVDYDYKDPVVCLPQGEHVIDVYAATESGSVVYENDGKKSLRTIVVKDAMNVQEYDRVYNHGDYAGYEVTAVDADGNPAQGAYFFLSGKDGWALGSAVLDSAGRGVVFHEYPGECSGFISGIRNTAKLTWTDNSPIGMQTHHIDVSKDLRKVKVTVKQHEQMFANKYGNPELHLYRTADKLDAMPDFYDDTYIRCNWDSMSDTSFVFTANLYMQDGWLCGYLVQRDLRDSIPMIKVSDAGELNFDYTKYAYIKYTLDGKRLQAGYNYEGLMAAPVGQAPVAEWSNVFAPEFLLPGNYYACVVSPNNASELSYINAYVPSFKVECPVENSEVEVALTTLPDEDYVQVPLKLDGIFFLAGAKAEAEVKFLYNGQIPLAVSGENYKTVNTEVPFKVLKGDYDYSVKALKFDEKHHYVVGHERKVAVGDDTKVVQLDLSGLHYFNTIGYFDAEGNEIDWLDLWTPLCYASFYKGQDFLADCYLSSYEDEGLFIPEGDYGVKLFVGDWSQKIEHDATLHVDNQSGTTARIVLGKQFTPVEQVVAESNGSELNIRYVGGQAVVAAPVAAPVRVAVYALNGAKLTCANVMPGQRIDMSALSKGAYIVRLSQGNVNSAVKIVK